MERRKFLIGAGSAAIGSSALIGSGAFSSASVGRTAAVRVAGDSNAYLGLSATSAYAQQNSTGGEGTLSLNFAGGYEDEDGHPQGDGVNPEGITSFSDVFQITNNGSENVGVFIDDDGDSESGWSRSGYPDGTLNADLMDNNLISYHNKAGFFTDDGDITSESLAPDNRTPSDISDANNAHVLAPGDSLSVGWYINTEDIGSNSESYVKAQLGKTDSSIAVWAFTEDTASGLQSSE